MVIILVRNVSSDIRKELWLRNVRIGARSIKAVILR